MTEAPVRSLTFPPSAFSAALIACLVGFGGTVALVVQAAQNMGATPVQIISAVTALNLFKAVTGMTLSYTMRMPIVLAWSTAGAALVAASPLEIGFSGAVGVYLAAAAMMTMLGVIPALGRLAARIPVSVATGMLAGVLLPFCLGLFRTFAADAWLVGAILVVFILARQKFPIYAMLMVLAVCVVIVVARGDVRDMDTSQVFGVLSFTAPTFDWRAVVSLGVPLFLVTLASQNLPGLAVLRAAGYEPPPRPLLFFSGLASMIAAPFGSHFINLAAITAAICTGDEAHPDRDKRWVVGMLYGGYYLLLAIFAAPFVALFIAMPRETIAAITGVALIVPLSNALAGMMGETKDREAAILTFVATASGVTVFGIGSAFWGLMVGFITLAAARWLRR